MEWLQSIDVAVFRFCNLHLSHPLLDRLIPFLSWNAFFPPALILFGAALAWKGGRRGRVMLFFVAAAIAVGDGVICNSLKDWIARDRPFVDLPDAKLLVGRGKSGSFPSAHAANWAAGTAIAGFFYRRSLWVLIPATLLVAFSRLYLGVHYPSDVVGGMLLGAGYALALIWILDGAWRWAGLRWFPIWRAKLPSLRDPDQTEDPFSVGRSGAIRNFRSTLDQHWLRIGYVLIGALALSRLGYIASDTIELSEDEAYQWVWSKNLALSYFSKPPLIAYTQFLGTTLWGDTAFGVRFFSPIIAAVLGFLLLRFLAREVNVRAGFWLIPIAAATPLLAAGSILMTIDPLSVLFWTGAMIAGWKAVKTDSTAAWAWTGLWMGLGFLSKYIGLFQWVCWAVFFVLWKPARTQLRRPGPYLALGINLICLLPVLIWNAGHGWITVSHLADRGGLDEPWGFDWRPVRFAGEFLASELGLMNPVFFVAAIWAAAAIWAKGRRDPFLLYLFSMGAPLFLFYLIYTARARVQPNWIAPAVLPLFCLMAVYWEARWREGAKSVGRWLAVGLVFGLGAVVLFHDTDLIKKVFGRHLPPQSDPLRRLRGGEEMARAVGEARAGLMAEGRPVFIIGQHYGITGLLSFYLPEAKRGVPDDPLVFYQSADFPKNQFYFWKGYQDKKGQNAIYAQQTRSPRPPPARLLDEFETVKDLGVREVLYRGRVLHRLQLFECRGLK